MRSFGSDNHSGAHPDVLAAIADANADHAKPYGDDPWTARAQELLRAHLGDRAEPFLVFNGTGANVSALRACLKPWEGVICADTAHLTVDEGGAPERMGGIKLMTTATPDGRLTPDDVERMVRRVGDEHAVQARVVSVTQSTELGTVYPLGELRALADAAHAHGLLLHVDGSRIANAAAALSCSLADVTSACGVDVISFGATKNGALGAEAVVFLDPSLADGFKYLRKQSMQLASKGRFLAAQLVALLEGELWLRNAAHANAMAARLAAAVEGLAGVTITQAVEANAVFAILERAATAELQRSWPFYVWDEGSGEVRWMCSWDTTADEVDAFAADIARVTRA